MVSRGREGEHLRRDTGTGVWSTRRAEEAALVTGEEYSSRRSAGGQIGEAVGVNPVWGPRGCKRSPLEVLVGRLGAQGVQEVTSRGASGPFRGPGGCKRSP